MLIAPQIAEICSAARALEGGSVVAFPTETVYGLGADARREDAVKRVYALKGRPSFNPLIVHVPNLRAAEDLGIFNETARTLAATYWPGPLTLVLDLKPDSPLCSAVTAGLDSVAVRVPEHPVARLLLEACEFPIAAPSANRSGHVSPTTARHVEADFGEELMILDGGPCEHGLESTIVDCRGETAFLLRPGHIHAELLQDVGVWIMDEAVADEDVVAPGQLARHYAPSAALRLNAVDVRPGEAALSFGDDLPGWRQASATFNLSPAADLNQAAHNLFDALRTLDATGAATIAVAPIPMEGLGRAINNRLARAAAPK